MYDIDLFYLLIGLLLSSLLGCLLFIFSRKDGDMGASASKIPMAVSVAILVLMMALVYCGQGMTVATMLPIFIVLILRLSKTTQPKK